MGPFLRQANQLICWPGECQLRIQTMSLKLPTLAGWLAKAATGEHWAYPRHAVAQAWGQEARHAKSTPTFATSNRANLMLLLRSYSIMTTRTQKRMGQGPLPLLWALKQKQLVPKYCRSLVWMRSVTYKPQSLNAWYVLKQIWYNGRPANIEGICWWKQNVCVLLCVMLNQLHLPTPSNIPQKQ